MSGIVIDATLRSFQPRRPVKNRRRGNATFVLILFIKLKGRVPSPCTAGVVTPFDDVSVRILFGCKIRALAKRRGTVIRDKQDHGIV